VSLFLSVILERKCSTAGNGHSDALFVQLSGRLIAAENKVQLFRIAILDTGVTKKTYRERKSGHSVGDRRAGGCAAGRGKANYVRGVRDPQSSPRPDCRRHGAYRPAPARLRGRRRARRFLPYRLPLPFYRYR
jgi:hypothetical protein